MAINSFCMNIVLCKCVGGIIGQKKMALASISRGTNKPDILCGIIGGYNCVARVDVGTELSSGFIVGFSSHFCIGVVLSSSVCSCLGCGR